VNLKEGAASAGPTVTSQFGGAQRSAVGGSVGLQGRRHAQGNHGVAVLPGAQQMTGLAFDLGGGFVRGVEGWMLCGADVGNGGSAGWSGLGSVLTTYPFDFFFCG
jgi:hypothetical protein